MSTQDLLTTIRTDIKTDLFEEVVALLQPKINEMLHQNIFTFKEAVAFLKVSESTLRRLVKEQEIPHYRIRGTIYFRQWELNEYIEQLMIRKVAN